MFFGKFLTDLKHNINANSSETGLALMLFSLVASIRAETVIEIGRWKGLSAYAIAAALKFIDEEMKEAPPSHCQRKELDYLDVLGDKKRILYSIDPYMQDEVVPLIDSNNLSQYVKYINVKSWEVNFHNQADIILIDGDHTLGGCAKDVTIYVSNHLKVGGYFILHDYFGWYGDDGSNNSPIKKVCDKLVDTDVFERLFIDTKFMSFVIFRKKKECNIKMEVHNGK